MFCSYFNSIDTLDKGKGAFNAGALEAMKTNVFHTVKILTFGLFAVYLKKGVLNQKYMYLLLSLCFLFILHTHVKRKTMSLFCFHIHAYYLFYSLWFAYFYVELFFLIFIFYIPIGSLLHFYA